jgi:hypothetical protein
MASTSQGLAREPARVAGQSSAAIWVLPAMTTADHGGHGALSYDFPLARAIRSIGKSSVSAVRRGPHGRQAAGGGDA